jgi:hypothetical protein
MFRNGTQYNRLLNSFEMAVIKFWPEYESNGGCITVGTDPADLEQLMLSSYRLMKYIRTWLKKKRIDYDEAHKFPNLYVALEEMSMISAAAQNHQPSLAVEALKLEAVSRAAYHWMKTYKYFKKNPTEQAVEGENNNVPPIKNKPVQTQNTTLTWCQCCKTEPADAENGFICNECSDDANNNPDLINSLHTDKSDMMFPTTR